MSKMESILDIQHQNTNTISFPNMGFPMGVRCVYT